MILRFTITTTTADRGKTRQKGWKRHDIIRSEDELLAVVIS